jgi:glycosyltransferase involved in cell wall biosynthesis
MEPADHELFGVCMLGVTDRPSRRPNAGFDCSGPELHEADRTSQDSRDWPPVSVILPAYDEENAVATSVGNISRVLKAHGIVHEVIVVDDGSQDRTVEEATRASARVLRHHKNRGYGASIKTGIMAARYDVIVISDADGTYPAESIPTLVELLDHADMVVGSRTGKHVHIPLVRRLPKKFLGWLAARIAGQPIPDLNSGLRAFRRDCVKQYFPILSNKFSFTTTSTLALLADDYRVLYHPIDYHQRIGKSKISPRHFMDFTVLILRMSMMFQPLKVFVPLAFACIGVGLSKSLFDIVALFLRHAEIGWYLLYQPVLSTSATLFLMTGFQLLFIGMLTEAVVRRISLQAGNLAPSHGLLAFEPSLDGRSGGLVGTATHMSGQ